MVCPDDIQTYFLFKSAKLKKGRIAEHIQFEDQHIQFSDQNFPLQNRIVNLRTKILPPQNSTD